MKHSVQDIQVELLSMINIFHDFCKKHNLKYYIIGGTMLGAIRHKGFIPWDDDIDIGMPRNDYGRLLMIPQEQLPDGFEILNHKNRNDFVFTFSKFVNKNTTLVENINSGYIEGIYLDVFPLDGSGNTLEDMKKNVKRIRNKIRLINYSLVKSKDKNIIKRITKKVIGLCARTLDIDKLFSSLEVIKDTSWDKDAYAGNIHGIYGMKEVMPKEYYGEPVLYQFGDTYLFGVAKPHEYLTHVYGDYMKLPPVEKQESHHEYMYLDLKTPYGKLLDKK